MFNPFPGQRFGFGLLAMSSTDNPLPIVCRRVPRILLCRTATLCQLNCPQLAYKHPRHDAQPLNRAGKRKTRASRFRMTDRMFLLDILHLTMP